MTEMHRQLIRMREHLQALNNETVHDRTLIADKHTYALFGVLEAMSQEVRAQELAA